MAEIILAITCARCIARATHAKICMIIYTRKDLEKVIWVATTPSVFR